MTSKIRVAILGYGNLGRGVEAAMPYNPDMTLVGVFSQPGRDPRGWVVSAAYAAVIREAPRLQAGDDAASAGWFTVEQTEKGLLLRQGDAVIMAGELAFDHADILKQSFKYESIFPVYRSFSSSLA